MVIATNLNIKDDKNASKDYFAVKELVLGHYATFSLFKSRLSYHENLRH